MSVDATEATTQQTCPSCGEPVVTLTVVGPSTGYVGPCGCQVHPLAVGRAES